MFVEGVAGMLRHVGFDFPNPGKSGWHPVGFLVKIAARLRVGVYPGLLQGVGSQVVGIALSNRPDI